MPSVPTPAAARYSSAALPSPPAPTTSTLAFLSRFCPSIPTSGMIRCRLYLATSSLVSSVAGSTSGGRRPAIGSSSCGVLSTPVCSCSTPPDRALFRLSHIPRRTLAGRYDSLARTYDSRDPSRVVTSSKRVVGSGNPSAAGPGLGVGPGVGFAGFAVGHHRVPVGSGLVELGDEVVGHPEGLLHHHRGQRAFRRTPDVAV